MTRGARAFKRATAGQIRGLLLKVRYSGREEQKRLRQEIRDLGFFISDFRRSASGFTADDFDRLVERGDVQIID